MNVIAPRDNLGSWPCYSGRGDFGFESANSLRTTVCSWSSSFFWIASLLCTVGCFIGCGDQPAAVKPTGADAKSASNTAKTAADGKSDARQPAGENSPGAAESKGQLRIAAASDLKFALEEVRSQFLSRHSGATVEVTYGSSGSFFAQLANEAPFDLFLAADIDYARRLVEQGQGVAGGEFAYARGHIVVWVPQDSPHLGENKTLEFLRDGNVQKIAIANPKTAPYGRAAVAALEKLGVYEAVKPKLVYGENVAQAAQMVESGAADAGITALSLAVSPALRDKGRHWRVPDDAYPSLVQGGVVLRWARDAALANEFRDFLLSGEGTSILKQFGFDEP